MVTDGGDHEYVRNSMKRNSTKSIVLLAVALPIVAASCASKPKLEDGLYASIETKKGEILIKLEPEKAPMTVMNFVGLAEGTIKTNPPSDGPFYDGLTFHRVEPGFVIQGGDPNGNGTGGPGYEFPTETSSELLHDAPGVVAMANSGPDTNGSQFYITMGAAPHLDGGYNVFGHVVKGYETVEKITVGDTIVHVRIIRSGPAYKDYTADESTFRALVADVKKQHAEAAAAKREAELETIHTEYPEAVDLDGTGVLVDVVTDVDGPVPANGDSVAVQVAMSLLDGTKLNDTRADGKPLVFTYMQQRLLRGMELAIGTMSIGDRIKAIVPPDLAFGSRGAPPSVPPDSFIIFDLERVAPN